MKYGLIMSLIANLNFIDVKIDETTQKTRTQTQEQNNISLNDIKTSNAIRLHKTLHIDATDKNGDTGLIMAARRGYLETVKTLLDRGANTNIANKHGDTALIEAVKQTSTEIISILLESGCDINKANKLGNNAMITAAHKNNIEIIKILITENADIPELCDCFSEEAKQAVKETVEKRMKYEKERLKDKQRLDSID